MYSSVPTSVAKVSVRYQVCLSLPHRLHYRPTLCVQFQKLDLEFALQMHLISAETLNEPPKMTT
jgi:hypothetical protein